MTKGDYRRFFTQIKDFVKFNYFLKKLDINQSCFSKFMKNEYFDYQMSLEKLQLLYNEICESIGYYFK